MINISLLDKLYTSYGFEISKESDDVSVYIYRKSRYFGVDIIALNSSQSAEKITKEIQEKYSKLGFAVNNKKINTNNEAEIELFKSFFSFESTVARLKRKYDDFQKKQTKSLLGFNYQYIESPFELQNHEIVETGLFDIIESCFASDKPELIIIEAAAGYGKTCTAYEILKRISNNPNKQIPIFTELSRNRSAKIFRYILLDEIDTEYPSLNSELVIKEIKNGRIPLIIDGFDELLEKVKTDSLNANAFEEVETMLDTIGHLLEFKTKIILTTRKTAIFTGLEFDTWLAKWHDKFSVSRIALKEPRIKDWLGGDKFSLVKDLGIPIQYLANPVILTFLKNITLADFRPLMENPEILVDHYFEKMLEREKERQSLIMNVDNQLVVFRNVTKILIELDTTAEDKDFFKEIILDENRKLIEYTRTLYGGFEKPSIENIVDKLATHALLDRKGRDQSQVGFINDFIFGTLIGQVIISTEIDRLRKNCSIYMFDLAVTAYRVQSQPDKHRLWEQIQQVLNKFDAITVFTYDIYLKNALQRDYIDISISDLTFFNSSFCTYIINSTVFVNCYFKNCIFQSEKIKAVSFINCTFDQCSTIDGDFLDNKNEITAIKCRQKNCSLLVEEPGQYEDNKPEIVNETEKVILSGLWALSNSKGHHISQLSHIFSALKKREVMKSLKSLETKGFLKVSGIYVHFEINRIHAIKEIIK